MESALQLEILVRARRGDREAIGEIYDLTFERVYRFAMRLTGNQADAEDLTADTYERGIRALPNFEWRGVSVSTWLLGIARNTWHEQSRQRSRISPVPLTDILGESLAEAPAEIEDLTIVPSMLASLTEAQAEVLALRLEGLKLREIADITGKAEGTVKALQFAAVKNLRKLVSAR